MKRREFFQTAIGVAGALGIIPNVAELFANSLRPTKSLPERLLGSTGESLPMLGLGGSHMGMADTEKDARILIDTALEEGISFFDTAESYQSGQSERWLGASLRDVRKDIFLMTKTFAPKSRSAESAERHLEGSLKRLKTDRLDLWQLHSLQSPEDVDMAFRKGGAMEYILEMKKQGVVRYVGVTGHTDPSAHVRALEHWDKGWKFDCMQIPLSLSDYHQQSFEHQVLPGLVKRKIGVLAMKTLAAGNLLSRKICTVEECLLYSLSLKTDLAIVGMEEPWMVRANAGIVRSFKAMSTADMKSLLARVKSHIRPDLEPYKSHC